MPRAFLRLAYRGTAYHGWQTQAGPRALPTVQSTVEDALHRVLGYRGHLHGCGRTDAGVHATDYMAHFDFMDPADHEGLADRDWRAGFLRRLNHALPADIAVHDVQPVLAKAHAQRSATWRAYRYRIATRKSPFTEGLVGQYHHRPLDLAAMRDAVSCFAKANSPATRGPSSARGPAKTRPDGTLDFRAFCRRPDQYPHTRCRIDACALTEAADGELRFDVRADRFLHNQIRLMVGRLLDVGTGRLAVGDVERALATGEALSRKRPAAASGLYLVGVGYPAELFAPSS